MGAIHFSLDESFLKMLQGQLPLALFVETGTFLGDTLEMAGKHFARCQSVELSPHYFEQARRRFVQHHGVELHCGASQEFLRSQRDMHSSVPTLFWLDAHWCVSEQAAGRESQSPLLAELEAIQQLHPESVLLIDDARLYLCAPPRPHRLADWPDWHDVLHALLPLGSMHRVVVINDVIVFHPGRIRAAIEHFAYEHGVDWLRLARDARRLQERKARWDWLRIRRKTG